MNKTGICAAIFSIILAGSAFAADGGAVSKAKCAACHGADGQGTAMAPAFQGNKFIIDSTEADIADVIRNGRNGEAKKYKQFAMGMPKQNLSEEDIKAVIAYLKTMAGKK